MGNFYKYNFVSPEPIYSTVKEELKSYFDTGAIDDLMFPTYLDKCLKKLGRTTYVITEEVLFIEDFQARLPDNFYAVKEAWMTTEVNARPYQAANSFYSQSATTTIQISPVISNGTPCTDNCTTGCPKCMPELIQAVYKTTNGLTRSFTRSYLLKPGNISAKQHCSLEYSNNPEKYSASPGSSSFDSFDIRDNKFVTNFRTGVVHLVFYSEEYDETGNQLIPDNYRIKEYVEAFIKFKMFETLTNQTNDETFNQLQQKMMYHKQISEEAYILADIEIKKQTISQKIHSIKRDANRLRMYDLPTNRLGRRRNY